MDSKALGARIQFYREQADMTQVELAERIGCTPQHISAIERGVKTPKLETFAEICTALKVPPNLLLCDWAADSDEMWEAEVAIALQVLTPQLRAQIKPHLMLNLREIVEVNKTSC
jgi:transcriptional regulator with XRE-family HTH domain